VFAQETVNTNDAFRLERQIKGWCREKKVALIRGDYAALVELSKSKDPAPED
jgi:putative endonuclease